jgi:hypothetical protein
MRLMLSSLHVIVTFFEGGVVHRFLLFSVEPTQGLRARKKLSCMNLLLGHFADFLLIVVRICFLNLKKAAITICLSSCLDCLEMDMQYFSDSRPDYYCFSNQTKEMMKAEIMAYFAKNV